MLTSVTAMLVALLAIIALTVAWVAYTKDDSEENIKKGANLVASIIFFGIAILAIAAAIIST